jgi:hypothetical protein
MPYTPHTALANVANRQPAAIQPIFLENVILVDIKVHKKTEKAFLLREAKAQQRWPHQTESSSLGRQLHTLHQPACGQRAVTASLAL